jgi:CHAD domain-containing protein
MFLCAILTLKKGLVICYLILSSINKSMMETGINLGGEWKANEKEVFKNLSSLQSEISEEAIHETRVAIKKLRAYCNLLNELDKSVKVDLPQTKALFDILGKHREWEMVLKQLQKSPDDLSGSCPMFAAYINRAKEEASNLIKNTLDEYNFNEVTGAGKMLEDLIQILSLHKVTLNSLKVIKRDLLKLKKHSVHFDEDPHYTRKLLKVIFYWINLFPPETLYSKKQVKHLDSFLDKLGKWHDIQVSCIKIKHYRKDHLTKSLDEYRTLKKLEDDIKASADKLFNKLKPELIVNELTERQ